MADTSTKSFHLRWNNHISNLRTLLEYLYNEQSFVDVTLSCSDGMIRAHKLVLSACSPYFDTIFRENPCKHPTVILRGISLREMQLIIEYMYVGAVDIPENELSALLKIANELHIKGLVQDPADDDEIADKRDSGSNSSRECRQDEECEDKHQESYESQTDHRSSPENICQNDSNSIPENNDDIKNHNMMESDEAAMATMCGIMSMAQVKMEEGGMNSIKDENMKMENYRYEYNPQDANCYPSELFCRICERGFQNKQNMKRHMQTHSGVKPHQCKFCELSFLRLSHLQRHHRVHTGERPFSCDQCDKQFSRSDKLKQHIAQHHSGIVIPKQQKQRGRPRKVPLNIPLNLTPMPNTKITNENSENINNVPSYPTLIYSVMQ